MDKRYLKVDGYSNLVRDCSSNAIVNQDQLGYENYRSLKNVRGKERERLLAVEKEIASLKTDIGTIKDLLIQLVDKESK